MKLHFTKPFIRDYRSLSATLQKRVDKQLRLLLQDLRYPSLRANKVDFQREIWRARITDAVRFTFQIEGDTYILRRVGGHDETLRSP
ncbi:MAG: hypothetical protein ACE5PV_01850 [Candidatus Poribacteria bacterium]